jgi:ATP-binding cassette subfamily F protein 3
VARLADVHKAYGENTVYAGVDFIAERGERVALVGVNGAGKSTLLKIVAGVLPFDRGERTLGAHVDAHYYAQHQLDALDPSRTVLEELERADPTSPVERLRTLLGSFLFSGDAVDKRVSVLSGGEKARVALAKLLVRPAALLCMDEPTNHLDLASKEVLEEALGAFTGTIVFISHDRYFVNRIATQVVDVDRGRLTTYLGNYDDYLSAKSRVEAPPAVAGPISAPARARDPGRGGRGGPVVAGNDLAREVKGIQARLGTVETQIHELEARLAEIGRLLADPGLYRDGQRAREIAQSRKETEARVTGLMKEWEGLSLQLSTALGAR